jgi:hypothetical protein
MADHDSTAFQDLFDSEPKDASAAEAADLVDMYAGMIAMMERQLEETRMFAQAVSAPLREYLSRENVAILVHELGVFRERLAYWRRRAGLAELQGGNGAS